MWMILWWFLCIELALDFRWYVPVITLGVMLGAIWAKRTIIKDSNTAITPLTGPAAMSFLHGVALASLAKAALQNRK